MPFTELKTLEEGQVCVADNDTMSLIWTFWGWGALESSKWGDWLDRNIYEGDLSLLVSVYKVVIEVFGHNNWKLECIQDMGGFLIAEICILYLMNPISFLKWSIFHLLAWRGTNRRSQRKVTTLTTRAILHLANSKSPLGSWWARGYKDIITWCLLLFCRWRFWGCAEWLFIWSEAFGKDF